MNSLVSLKDIVENYSEELKYLPLSEIVNLQALLEDIRNRPKSIWDLETKDGKTYYRLYGAGNIVIESFSAKCDEDARDMGNAFLTREEAEFERERRKIEAIMKKYSRPFEWSGENWSIDYSYYRLLITSNVNVYNSGLPYFESREIAQKVIDEIGEDRLIKYWFRVK